MVFVQRAVKSWVEIGWYPIAPCEAAAAAAAARGGDDLEELTTCLCLFFPLLRDGGSILRRVLLLLLLLLLRCLSGGDVAAGWASCGRRQCTPPRPSTTQHKVGSCRQPQTQEFSLQQFEITKCPLRLQS